ncbi:fructose-1,6-bisphosphatase-3 [Clostridium pascui]|uniref:fructose-1,6-bisphosphatase n=1 Tax=Clostridium pascui TaxID=46609 RepID=UPI00195C3332|nr:fructose-1,6-bisphosphatase [Clostridium pascui]MBM7870994.1 fructose-1,6-bisphosphatase-3 [Clostridium pascui]
MTLYDENNINIIKNDLRYLKLLSTKYPTISLASSEIINLQSILNLPKGTEHFISDIHGEYESFTHMLKNASGVIKRKLDEIFGTSLMEREKAALATLIYYPEEKMELLKRTEQDLEEWYKITLYRLIQVCKSVSSKYTRSKVRKALPEDFSYIIEELLNEQVDRINRQEYYTGIIDTIIDIGCASEFVVALSKVIQRLVVDRLHIIGDIYDRGPGAEIIMDALMNHHSIDIQWGNHDIIWMGAASGSRTCAANALRVSLRYANLSSIEDGYGINLLPLATFALEIYGNDPCKYFIPKTLTKKLPENEVSLLAKMHKAIAIIQFKLEGQKVKRHPEFEMDYMLLLDKMDLENKTVTVDGKTYPLRDTNFPTLSKDDPYKLTPEEEELINKLTHSFVNSEKLQRHIRFLYSKGSLYLVYNSNILFHGCIPLDENGDFETVNFEGKSYKGKSLLDMFDRYAREAYFYKKDKNIKNYAMDIMWYLWCGQHSPLFGKNRITTFERYFIEDKLTHIEEKNTYYKLINDEELSNRIFEEFHLDKDCSHIINGHIPVKTIQGESPIKANGKLLVIDGGFCKAYQPETGIAGYTLIYNSYGFLLTSHEPFDSIKKAIEEEKDILSSTIIVEHGMQRKRVADTDIGEEITYQIKDLEKLLIAYRKGLIDEI